MYLVLIQSATTALTGGRLRWHKLQRAGLGPAQPGVEDRIPVQSIAPPVDTWPPALSERPAAGHPAAGRAVARSAVPPQPISDTFVDLQNLPSAGSPPVGGSGPVYTG
jgi:hypothetical protein